MGREVAWIEQDYLRRILLREHDKPNAANIDLISLNVRFALGRGRCVLLEGILRTDHYAAMLEQLHHDYQGTSAWYYFDVSFEETARRHAGRPQAADFSTEDMRRWYRHRDLLDFVAESVIGETASLRATVDGIYDEAVRDRRCR